jgi:hypothetical protein
MKTKKSIQSPSSLSLERWTIERLDRDAGMARIETVPARSGPESEKLKETLIKQNSTLEMDPLSVWDARRLQSKSMLIARLRKILKVSSSKGESLAENMVFYILHRGKAVKPEHVYHVTQAARATAKQLHENVSNYKEARHDS